MAFCGTLGHGSVVDFVVLGYWLDLMILGFFSNLIDSVIRFYDVPLMYGLTTEAQCCALTLIFP